MAKISARGDREVARWRRKGDYMVLTEQGRLLEKVDGDTTYRVRQPRGQKRWTLNTAGAQATVLGYEATSARR